MASRAYIWPSTNASLNVIALSQSVTSLGVTPVSIVLNGSYSNGPTYNQNIPGQYAPILLSSSSNVVHQSQDAIIGYSVPFPGFFRKIRISSSNDISALTFHVSGTYAGQLLTEDIAGPNATNADSVNFYDNILSITVTGVAATYNDVNIGLGLSGGLSFFNYSWREPLNALSIQVIIAGTINYSGGFTLQEVQTLPFASLFLPDVTGSLTNITTNTIASSSIFPFRYATLLILGPTEGGGTDATGSLQAFFLEGGV